MTSLTPKKLIAHMASDSLSYSLGLWRFTIAWMCAVLLICSAFVLHPKLALLDRLAGAACFGAYLTVIGGIGVTVRFFQLRATLPRSMYLCGDELVLVNGEIKTKIQTDQGRYWNGTTREDVCGMFVPKKHAIVIQGAFGTYSLPLLQPDGHNTVGLLQNSGVNASAEPRTVRHAVIGALIGCVVGICCGSAVCEIVILRGQPQNPIGWLVIHWGLLGAIVGGIANAADRFMMDHIYGPRLMAAGVFVVSKAVIAARLLQVSPLIAIGLILVSLVAYGMALWCIRVRPGIKSDQRGQDS